MTRKFMRTGASLIVCAAVGIGATAIMPSAATAKPSEGPPPLVITNAPLPPELSSHVYSSPSVAPRISPSQISGHAYYGMGESTVVGNKIDTIRTDLFALQGEVAYLSEQLATLEMIGQKQAAEYYASVATISTQLQSGTTPGNPRLVRKLTTARDNLEKLSANIAALNDLAVEISNAASMSSFLLDTARATFGLSGAIEEDHVRLAQMEDAVNNTVVVIDRLLNNVNDDISRTTAYLASERDNLRTMSLAITTGDLFGKSLSNRPFSGVQRASFATAPVSGYGGYAAVPPVMEAPGDTPSSSMTPVLEPGRVSAPVAAIPAPIVPASPAGHRPLVKIRFDRPNVAYEQPVYMAVNEALTRYPNARFELVAVHPDTGNAAEVAIESTKARRNAERVLRSLTQMGLDMGRVDLSYTPSPAATTNEVHLYVH